MQESLYQLSAFLFAQLYVYQAGAVAVKMWSSDVRLSDIF